jgi:hypothetical protein
MTKLFDIVGFVAQLHTIERDLTEVGPAVIARACEMVLKEAKRVIGKGYPDWPALKADTIAEKVRQGYAAPKPLLRTGDMRASIEYTVDKHKMEGEVGTDSDIAVFQELGTSRIPPRSFLASGAKHVEARIHTMAARAVVSVLEGRGLYSAEMAEFLHLLKHAVHHVKEDLIDPLFEDPDERNERQEGHRR